MFQALKPYRLSLLQEVTAKGWPLVRHPAFYAVRNAYAQGVVDECFFFGEALLVAPVYEPMAQSWTAYLPDIGSEYVHLWTNETYEGGRNVTVETPFGKPAVFVRWPLRGEEAQLLAGLFDFVRRENGTDLCGDY